jgi:hypothetical protein
VGPFLRYGARSAARAPASRSVCGRAGVVCPARRRPRTYSRSPPPPAKRRTCRENVTACGCVSSLGRGDVTGRRPRHATPDNGIGPGAGTALQAHKAGLYGTATNARVPRIRVVQAAWQVQD